MSPAPDTPHQVVVFDVLGSTNDSILALGATDAAAGTTHVALAQTSGRGREGRRWWSPPGAGLWMSTLLRPAVERRLWSGIAIVAGAAVRDALLACGVADPELHWPNDIYVRGRKIGGILGEVRSDATRAWLALGVGVNIDLRDAAIRRAMPAEVREIATSIGECGVSSPPPPADLARIVLDAFWPLYEAFEDARPVSEIIGDRLTDLGQAVEVRPPGAPPWRGVVRGLEDGGELRVEPADAPGSTRAVTVGDVVYLDGGDTDPESE